MVTSQSGRRRKRDLAEKEQYGFILLAQRSETGEMPHAEIVHHRWPREVRGISGRQRFWSMLPCSRPSRAR